MKDTAYYHLNPTRNSPQRNLKEVAGLVANAIKQAKAKHDRTRLVVMRNGAEIVTYTAAWKKNKRGETVQTHRELRETNKIGNYPDMNRARAYIIKAIERAETE